MLIKHEHIKFLIFIFLAAITSSNSQDLAVYQFLEVTPQPYTLALGGKNVSSVLNSNNITFNPALLDSNQADCISFDYTNYLTDINLTQITFIPKSIHNINLSIGVKSMNYGQFERYDEQGQFGGNFSATDNAVFITLSNNLDTNIRIGASLKAIYSAYDTYISYGYAIDLGLLVQIASNTTLGVSVRNIGNQLKPYSTMPEPLPFTITVGLTNKLKYAPFAFNFTFDNLNSWNLRYVSPLNQLYLTTIADTISFIYQVQKATDELFRHFIFGLDIYLSPKARLLFGYNYRRAQELSLPTVRTLNGWSGGFYFKSEKINFSYAFTKYPRFTTHSLGVGLNLHKLLYRKIRRHI